MYFLFYSFADKGRYLISRDYLTLKIWDMHMERLHLKVINIHSHLKGMLCELYEADQLFDKFRVASSPNMSSLLTGGYGYVVLPSVMFFTADFNCVVINRNTAHIWGQDGVVKATMELPIPPPPVSRADGTQKPTAHLSPELADLKVDKKV